MSLLFARGFTSEQGGRVLLVSGNRDWVVPPDPEAIAPMRWGRAIGNQLVLVQGGDHFNLRPQGAADGGVLGPLLFAWTEAACAPGPRSLPTPARSGVGERGSADGRCHRPFGEPLRIVPGLPAPGRFAGGMGPPPRPIAAPLDPPSRSPAH
jgi:hypothetical protein